MDRLATVGCGSIVKILFAARSSLGMGSFIQPLLMALASTGHQLHVLMGKVLEDTKIHQLWPEINWINADTLDVIAFSRVLRKVSNSLDPQLIYVYNPGTIPCMYLSGLRFSGKAFVYQNDEYLEPRSFRLYKFFEKDFSRNAHLVVLNERNRARFMASEYHLPKLPLTVPGALSKHLAPTEETLLQGQSDKSEYVDLVYVGSIGRDRLIDRLLKSLTFLPEKFRLIFFAAFQADDPYARKCFQIIAESGLTARITINRPIPNEELLEKLGGYDVGIALYDDNTLGNYYCQPQKIYEYVACGVPFVGPNYPGIELIVAKHRIGSVCDPKSPESIAQAILAVIARNKAERLEQFRYLRQVFFANLAYENHTQPLIDTINRIFLS